MKGTKLFRVSEEPDSLEQDLVIDVEPYGRRYQPILDAETMFLRHLN